MDNLYLWRLESMKKISIVMLICSLCFCLTACDPSRYRLNYEKLAASVIRVELINYDAPKAKIINTFISQRRVRVFDFDKVEIIETLNEENLDGFLQDLSKAGFWNIWGHSNSPVGVSIRIIYNDDYFDVFSYTIVDGTRFTFGHRFNNNGKLTKYVGLFGARSDFVNVINSHFATQIE
jgi:hypothetical protein